ncbi:MAG: ClbS/DfsB family four-helix bundle protein [Ktedonobacteraceae bacterium]
MTDPTTKAELLEMMQQSQTAFEALLAPLNATQMTTPVSGDWSIKDVLVHFITWQGRAVQTLEAAQRNEQPQLHPVIKTDEEMHHFNDATYVAHRSRPLAEVQQDFRTSYQRLLASIEALREEDLFEPGRFAWHNGKALWSIAEEDTRGHYNEHALVIEAWLARQKV